MMKSLIICLLLFSLFPSISAIAEDATSPGVTVVSPTSGEIVRPGDEVSVEVQVDNSINPDFMGVMVKVGIGVSALPPKQITGPPFQTSVTLPAEASGPVLFLIALLNNTTGEYFGGADVTVNVVPAETPLRITPSDKLFTLSPPDTSGNFALSEGLRTISVRGFYEGDITRNISFPVTGTNYTSSDVNIVEITADGVLEPVAPGRAYITISHKGVEAFSEVIVEDPSQDFLPPIDITNRVEINRSGFRRDLATGLFRQAVELKNISGFPLSGISLVLVNLTDGVKLTNAYGNTTNILPLNSPYVHVRLLPGDPFLDPGETKVLELEFANPQGKTINYGTMVVEGSEP